MAMTAFMQEVPSFPYEFLEELLDILGEPQAANYFVNVRGFESGDLQFSEQRAKLSGTTSVESILNIYQNSLDSQQGRGESRNALLSSLSWRDSSKDNWRANFAAEFKPDEFEAVFTLGYKEETARKIEALIQKHGRGEIRYKPLREEI